MDTKILDRADSDRKLQIKELLHIDQKKPTLNIKLVERISHKCECNRLKEIKPTKFWHA